jgi:septum formation protein
VRLYLASTSPARLALLRAAGVEPIVLPSDVDEDAAVADAEATRGAPLSTPELVLLLAEAKARAVLARHGDEIDGLLLGGDSAFAFDGQSLGKPHLPEVARERWRAQRGRTGILHSGQTLIDARHGGSGRTVGAVASAEVTFVDDMTDAEIDAYVATGEPLQVAGAFTIDSLGGPFIERIAGDPSTVVGLSLPRLRRQVRELGVEWTALWS